MSSRKKRSTPQQRIEWLKKHADIWFEKRRRLGLRFSLKSPTHKIVIAAMKRDGLIAPTTYSVDVKLSEEPRIATLDLMHENRNLR